MTEEEWLKNVYPYSEGMLEYLGAGASPRKLRYFLVACARRVLPEQPDDAMVNALATAEQFADGEVTKQALRRARDGVRTTHPTRAKQWDPLYTTYIRSVPAWHATREQIARGAREGAGCCAWSSARVKYGGIVSQTFPSLEYAAQCALVRDVFGNPFRPITFAPEWRTDTAMSLAKGMYESRDFSAMPILADALQDAGCDNPDVLNHCREEGAMHVRGCWVCDLVLGKS